MAECDYELARLARIEENKKRLAEGSARLRGETAPALEVDEHNRVIETSNGFQGERAAVSVCHCCRQPTYKLKAQCTAEGCPNHWCLSCLANKEGEDAEACNARGDWQCPACAGGLENCLCSVCRRKSGRAPLGAMWPTAQREGFKSVRAYMAAHGMV